MKYVFVPTGRGITIIREFIFVGEDKVWLANTLAPNDLNVIQNQFSKL